MVLTASDVPLWQTKLWRTDIYFLGKSTTQAAGFCGVMLAVFYAAMCAGVVKLVAPTEVPHFEMLGVLGMCGVFMAIGVVQMHAANRR